MNISRQTLQMLAAWGESFDFNAQILSASCKTCSFTAAASDETVLVAALRAHNCKLKKKTLKTNA